MKFNLVSTPEEERSRQETSDFLAQELTEGIRHQSYKEAAERFLSKTKGR